MTDVSGVVVTDCPNVEHCEHPQKTVVLGSGVVVLGSGVVVLGGGVGRVRVSLCTRRAGRDKTRTADTFRRGQFASLLHTRTWVGIKVTAREPNFPSTKFGLTGAEQVLSKSQG